MAQLGYRVNQNDGAYSVSSFRDRKLVFVGDLVDRGPGTVQVLRLVSSRSAPARSGLPQSVAA
jgi:protein phosphatase